jgi:hypothetical protein
MERAFFRMYASSEKLKKLAELNFCKNCYSKYLDLIHPEIEYLLSEPISDWRQTEENINVLWIKAKGLYNVVNSTVFSPHENAFKKARNETVLTKLKNLKDEGLIKDYTYDFLNKVRRRRNNIHPPFKFSKQDYILFREAKALTDTMIPPIIFDLKDAVWKKELDNIEKHAKRLLENTKLF